MPVLLNHTSFFHYVRPAYLINAAFFFAILAAVFLTLSFTSLYRRKRSYFIKRKVEKRFETLISNALLEEETAAEIPAGITRHLRSKIKRAYAIQLLVNARRSMRGIAGENIVSLYLQLGFKHDSISKFKSRRWHLKAEGIHELYMMNQQDMLVHIYRHTNNANEYVRTEAQTAVVYFSGFDGLRFLDLVSTPISDWQQVKLLEQLKQLTPKELTGLSKWLRSENESVVLFALRLAEVYQQFQVHEAVVHALSHQSEKVRIQAVKTLVHIADETTAAALTRQYYKERFTNKLNILNNISAVASDEDLDFLAAELENSNHFLKVAAANVIAACCSNGIQLLKDKASLAPQLYADIYQHVKFQISR